MTSDPIRTAAEQLAALAIDTDFGPMLLVEQIEAAFRQLLSEAERERDEVKEQAQLYLDQREMTLAAKRKADGEVSRLREALEQIANTTYDLDLRAAIHAVLVGEAIHQGTRLHEHEKTP